jgi:hypothetical protein
VSACVGCGTDLTGQRNIYTEVKGWEVPRVRGGTNHIYLREKTGRHMCASCLTDRKHGVMTGQTAMEIPE